MYDVDLISLAQPEVDLAFDYRRFFIAQRAAKRHGYDLEFVGGGPAGPLFRVTEDDVKRPPNGWFMEQCAFVTDQAAAAFADALETALLQTDVTDREVLEQVAALARGGAFIIA